ncbi:MAG: hypothetical protein IH591_03005 [Bacteroidales bacterium]|nr:hypothetical protein [Bacteroidales bacterium]
MKKLIIVFAAIVYATSGVVEGDPFYSFPVHNCDVYSGYLTGNMNTWTKGIADQEARYRKSLSSGDLYVLILAKYGYIGYLISIKNETEVRDIIASAEDNAAVLSRDKSYAAAAKAMSGALIAMKISLNPLKATYLGMRSLKNIEESLEIDNTDPTGWVEMGNARFHMPAIVGGSFSEAANCFSKAIGIFERNPELLKCNWHYLHALVWLGKSYESMGDLKGAKTIYEKLLKLEPGFQWVSRELYPELLKKMQGE